MRASKLICLAMLAVWSGGCAISPGPETPPGRICDFVRHQLEVDIPAEPPPLRTQPDATAATRSLDEAAAPPRSFRAVLESTLREPIPESPGAPDPSMLFLSGGSQNGAYGAGFLHGWARHHGGLRRFKVVTGISTGSILSTFAFLGDTELPYRYYRITRENQVLQPWVRSGGKNLGLTDLPTVIRRGAVGALQPLRDSLRTELDRATMQRVATEYDSGRMLYVGAVDVDTGQAVIFDMGEMAKRAAAPGADFERFRNCYVEAIIASSSVPLAAPPTFIDNRMYIDGGARFGLFSDEVGRVMESISLEPRTSRPSIYAIVNGTLEIAENCGKVDQQLCEAPLPPSGGLLGAHRDWRLDQLAFRSISILINQGYRFSAHALEERARELGYPFRLARIEPDLASYSYTLNDPTLGEGTETCPEWSVIDAERDRPLEFHARYMRCLAAYGYENGCRQRWRRPPNDPQPRSRNDVQEDCRPPDG